MLVEELQDIVTVLNAPQVCGMKAGDSNAGGTLKLSNRVLWTEGIIEDCSPNGMGGPNPPMGGLAITG